MSENMVDDLMAKIKSSGISDETYQDLYEIVNHAPERVVDFVKSYVTDISDDSTLFQDALSFLTEQAFQAVIEYAVETLIEPEKNNAARSIIKHGALQFPEFTNQYLEKLAPVDKALSDFIENYKDYDEVDLLNKDQYSATYHICFEESYFDRLNIDDIFRQHPTWKFGSGDGQSCRFGGKTEGRCHICGGELHHLITLEKIPDQIPVTGLSGLTLSACLSCLGWEEEVLYYLHNEAGVPTDFSSRSDEQVEPDDLATGLKETTALLVKTPDRWMFQSWMFSNGRQNLNRIGGPPSWIQDAQPVSCPKCDEEMRFIGQLDSNLPTAEDEEWLWGSGGICYLNWCDKCKISGIFWQCT